MMFNTNAGRNTKRNFENKGKSQNPGSISIPANANKTALIIRRLFFLLSIMTIIFIYSNSHADTTFKNDSTNVNGSNVRNQVAIMRPEKTYFILDTGLQGPNRPNAGATYWYGDTKATNSVTLTAKRCPVGYTPSVKLSFINSDIGGGLFYGNYVLQASFDTSSYSLYNIEAYSNKLTRNGTVTFRWDIFCKSS